MHAFAAAIQSPLRMPLNSRISLGPCPVALRLLLLVQLLDLEHGSLHRELHKLLPLLPFND